MKEVIDLMLLMALEYFNIPYFYRYFFQSTFTSLFNNWSYYLKNYFKVKPNKGESFELINILKTKGSFTEECKIIKTTKSLDNLLLDERNEKEVIKDFKSFLNNKNWYKKYGIPYKRNYYLYGMPGTGKTSIVKVLAKEFNYRLYTVDYDQFEHKEVISKLPNEDAIILIDEFSYNEYNQSIKKYRNLIMYLDGIHENNNVVTFIITNDCYFHTNQKYASLFRNGRIDVISYFNYCSINQAKRILEYLFDEKVEAEEIQKIFPSTILDYFLKGLSAEEIIQKIKLEDTTLLESDEISEIKHEISEIKRDREKFEGESYSSSALRKRLRENMKLAKMTDKQKEIYFKRKELTADSRKEREQIEYENYLKSQETKDKAE